MQAAKELNGNVMTPEKFLSQPSESNVRTPSLDKIDFELPTFDNPFKNPNHIPNLTGGIRKIVQLPPKIVGSLLKTNTNSVGENIVIEIFDDDEKNESEKVVSVTPKCLSNLKKIRKQKKASAPAALLSVIKKGNTIDGLLKLPIIATTCTQAPDKIPVKNPSTRSPAKIPSTMSPVKIPLTKNPVVIKAQTPKKPVVKAQTPLSRQLRDRKTDNLVQNLLKDPMSRRLSKREPSSTVLKPQPEVKKSKKDAEKDIKKTVASPIIPAPPVTIPEDGLQLSQPSPNKTKGLEKKSVAGYSVSLISSALLKPQNY